MQQVTGGPSKKQKPQATSMQLTRNISEAPSLIFSIVFSNHLNARFKTVANAKVNKCVQKIHK